MAMPCRYESSSASTDSTSPSSVTVSVTSFVTSTSSTITSVFVSRCAPTSIRIGSEPGGSLTSSSVAPGQRKPEAGQGSGAALPVGAHQPAVTGVQPSALVRSVTLLDVPPGQGVASGLPFLQ